MKCISSDVQLCNLACRQCWGVGIYCHMFSDVQNYNVLSDSGVHRRAWLCMAVNRFSLVPPSSFLIFCILMPGGSRRFRKSAVRSLSSPGLAGLTSMDRVALSRDHLAMGGRVYTARGLFSQTGVAQSEGDYIAIGEELRDDVEEEEDQEEVEAGGLSGAVLGKKQKQWRAWSETIIPLMVEPYISMLAKTNSLRDIHLVQGHREACSGCDQGRILDVSCVYFNSRFQFFYANYNRLMVHRD